MTFGNVGFLDSENPFLWTWILVVDSEVVIARPRLNRTRVLLSNGEWKPNHCLVVYSLYTASF